MKKILAMSVLLVGVLIIQMPQASAHDEYVGTWEGGWKAYLVVETLRPAKSGNDYIVDCTIKAISAKGTTKYFDYTFNFQDAFIGGSNGDCHVYFRDSSGVLGNFWMSSPGIYQVEHEAARVIFGITAYFIEKYS